MDIDDLRYDGELEAAAAVVRAALGTNLPSAAVILGSGLGGVADDSGRGGVAYRDIPGMPNASVSGHDGVLARGLIGDIEFLFFCGRAHYYEGVPANRLGFSVRLTRALGVTIVISCCAAGSLRAGMPPGTLVGVRDHINMSGANPLIGAPPEPGRDFFADSSRIYSPGLLAAFERIAHEQNIDFQSGVYAWVSGPSYETPAESAMLATLGADVVGMSLVPEALTAAAVGVRFAGLACITNLAPGVGSEPPDHAAVLDSAGRFIKPLKVILSHLPVAAP